MFAPAALNVEPLVADDERLSDDAPVELLIDLFNSDWWQHVVYNHVRFSFCSLITSFTHTHTHFC